jgi:hypothetical protein
VARKKDTSAWLRYIVNIWTLFTFAAIIYNFAMRDAFEAALGPVTAIYVGALIIYSAEKEFERWAEYYDGRHPGEIYVIAWTALLLALTIASFSIYKEYLIPSEVISAYIAVLSILAITKKSKSFFVKKRRRSD